MQIESWVVVPSCLAGESQAITTSRRAARVTFLIGMCCGVRNNGLAPRAQPPSRLYQKQARCEEETFESSRSTVTWRIANDQNAFV